MRMSIFGTLQWTELLYKHHVALRVKWWQDTYIPTRCLASIRPAHAAFSISGHLPMSSSAPLVYRALFTYIDPFFCTVGFIRHVTAPQETMTEYSSVVASISSGLQHLLDSIGSFFLCIGVLQAVLLRSKSSDAMVWRTVQGSIFLLDVCLNFATLRCLKREGRMQLSSLRAEDRTRLLINTIVGAVRLSCALGVGFWVCWHRTRSCAPNLRPNYAGWILKHLYKGGQRFI